MKAVQIEEFGGPEGWEGISVDTLLEGMEMARYVTGFCDDGYTTNLPHFCRVAYIN